MCYQYLLLYLSLTMNIQVFAVKRSNQVIAILSSIGAFRRLIMKLLAAVFLLSFFTGVAICDDDETMPLVCSGFHIITYNLIYIFNLYYLMYEEF